MSGDQAPAPAWWRPEQDALRRRWCQALTRAGAQRPRLLSALTATAARLGIDDQQLTATLDLQGRGLPHPAPSACSALIRASRPEGTTPMITDDRISDVHHFMLELTELTRRYGLELTDDETDGLVIYDQEHDAVLAHGVRFDDPEDEYHFSPYWKGWRDPTVPA